MTLARTHSVTLVGVQGHAVEIEADIENGLVALLLVGLPDTALREARDRIRAAIVNSREEWPQRRITVGLSPASLPKRGSSFDLGIAVRRADQHTGLVLSPQQVAHELKRRLGGPVEVVDHEQHGPCRGNGGEPGHDGVIRILSERLSDGRESAIAPPG